MLSAVKGFARWGEAKWGMPRRAGKWPAGQLWRRHMDVATVAVLSMVVVNYLVGSLTSTEETEKQLPHRY